jgi:hypothetical protein
VRFRDIFSTASSFVIPSVSPSIMSRRMLGTVYRLISSGVWVTVETPMLRSTRLGLTGPPVSRDTLQNTSDTVLDRGPSILFSWFDHVLVKICLVVPSWLDSTRSTLPLVDVLIRESVVVLLGCSANWSIGGPVSPGCSTVFFSVSELVSNSASASCSAEGWSA